MPVSLLACANTLGFEMCDIVDQQNLTDKTEAPVPPVQTGHDSRQSAGRGSWLRSWLSPWPVIALLALGLAIWQWVETRIRLSDTQVEIARRLSESDTLVNESQILARQAQEQVGVLQGKFGELEGMIAESRSQQATLETLYQDLAPTPAAWVPTRPPRSSPQPSTPRPCARSSYRPCAAWPQKASPTQVFSTPV